MQRRLIFGLLAVVTIWACDSATPSQPGTQAELSVVPVSVSAAPAISTLTITVSASDIASDLVFNVTMTNGEATDTITIPAGSDRTITVRGYDASNIETHRGSKTVNLTEGVNPQLTVVLEGLTGDQPLVVALGETTVMVTPETATVSVGGTEQLSAVVTDEAGDTLAVSVRWASSNPAIATVDDAGLVTGASAGSATIVGTYGGVGASAAVTISDYVAFAACGDPMMDQDGNIYGTVEINGLCWFSENLKAATYADGSPITEGADSAVWVTATEGLWANYDNDPAMNGLYGKIYNNLTVNDARGVCPSGWRVPSQPEWEALINGLGGYTVAQDALKSSSGWDLDGNGTNSSGFNGLPGGTRLGSETTAYTIEQGWSTGDFVIQGTRGAWWSSTVVSGYGGLSNRVAYLDSNNYTTDGAVKVSGQRSYQRGGVSIRCAL